MIKKLMTVIELADYLNCSQSLIRKQLRENKLKSIRIGAKILFDKEEIDEWVKKQLQTNNSKESGNYYGEEATYS